MTIIAGESSWPIKSSHVAAHVTRTGGQVGPIVFTLGERKISPMHVAPWTTDKTPRPTPNMIAVLRGDFFCMPFGANASPYGNENYPAHGETANSNWTFESRSGGRDGATIHLSLKHRARPGRVDKFIHLRPGEPIVYNKHVISGMSGPMCLGHHAMLKFPDIEGSGLIATSPTKFMHTYTEPLERPEARGYSFLQSDSLFERLDAVPTITGQTTDLTSYPRRRGWEDLVLLANVDDKPLAWTAVTFPADKFVWFALKDPRVLHSTVLWHSNGGRHYAPWSGRHINVMGLEEITGNFHYGIAGSAVENTISRKGHPTHINLDPERPLVVNYIFGVAEVPSDFGHVANITHDAASKTITIEDRAGHRITTACDVDFLWKAATTSSAPAGQTKSPEIRMQQITPFLWFDGRAEEAMNFYVSIFKNSQVLGVSRYGDAGPGPKGSAMSVSFRLNGQTFYGLNGGPQFQFTPAISFFVNCDTQAEVDDLWEKLSAGGEKSRCGWLKDQFGLSWQIVPSVLGKLLGDKDPAKSNRVMRAMLQMTKLDIAELQRAHAG
jgi:predicted 3-demethylubiquinone-9 3-methyltransferase (glyoxalase superfamily)